MDKNIAVLRLHIASNMFKGFLLGDLHIPGKPQTGDVLNSIASVAVAGSDEPLLSARTWKSWFECQPVTPKKAKIRALDLVSYQLEICKPGSHVYEDMVFSGLISTMTAPTKAKGVLSAVRERAAGYKPLSPIHLLLDAAEIASITSGFQDVKSDVLRAIAAQRIFDILHERWGPRNGYIYKEFRSKFRIEWEAANQSKRQEFVRRWESLGYNTKIFERLIEQGATPNWGITGIPNDLAPDQIYKLFLCLAADTEFLNEERVDAWSLDMATAALTLFSKAWSERYETFGSKISSESLFLEAFTKALFEDDPLGIAVHYIEPAMISCGCAWQNDWLEALSRARESLCRQLNHLGIAPSDLGKIIDSNWGHHPLVFCPQL